jgi:hypothetical protein
VLVFRTWGDDQTGRGRPFAMRSMHGRTSPAWAVPVAALSKRSAAHHGLVAAAQDSVSGCDAASRA